MDNHEPERNVFQKGILAFVNDTSGNTEPPCFGMRGDLGDLAPAFIDRLFWHAERLCDREITVGQANRATCALSTLNEYFRTNPQDVTESILERSERLYRKHSDIIDQTSPPSMADVLAKLRHTSLNLNLRETLRGTQQARVAATVGQEEHIDLGTDTPMTQQDLNNALTKGGTVLNVRNIRRMRASIAEGNVDGPLATRIGDIFFLAASNPWYTPIPEVRAEGFLALNTLFNTYAGVPEIEQLRGPAKRLASRETNAFVRDVVEKTNILSPRS